MNDVKKYQIEQTISNMDTVVHDKIQRLLQSKQYFLRSISTP